MRLQMAEERYREVEAFTDIPIYGGKLVLVVSNNLKRARAKRNDFLGGELRVEDELDNCPASFEFGYIDHSTIAHECFHLTCRLMEWNSVYLKSDNHEAHAIFLGWSVEWVYDRLREQKIRVKARWR